MKYKLKYVYYKTCSLLLGSRTPDYFDRDYRNKLAQLLPGRSSAVLLTIRGKVSVMGYKRWLRGNAYDRKVKFWIKRRGKRTIEALFVGKSKRLNDLVGFVKESKFTNIDKINERWLIKCKNKGLLALAKPVGKDMEGDKRFIITFAGDTSLGDYYLRKPGLEQKYERLQSNPMSFFAGVTPLTKNSSFLILNLETVLADNPESPLRGAKKWMGWDNPDRTTGVLKNLGVNAVSLANNHTMDFGPEVLNQTRRLLNEAGIQSFGAGNSLKEAAKPIKIQCEGKNSTKNIYVFGAMRVKWKKRFRDYNYYATKQAPGVNIFGIKRICSNISRLRKKDPTALIVVFPHWQGYDYRDAGVVCEIRDICKNLIDSGANYVFGHGTHMYCNCEKRGKGTVVYSIGNFVFNSPGRYGKFNALPYSVIIQLELNENRNGWRVNQRLYPILSDNKISGFVPKLIKTSDEADKFLKFFNDDLPENSKVNLNNDKLGFFYIADKKINKAVVENNNLNMIAQLVKVKINRYKRNTYGKDSLAVYKLIPYELENLGCRVERFGKYTVADFKGKKILFWQSIPPGTSLVGAKIVGNKAITREFLKKKGVSIAKGNAFSRRQKEQAMHYALKLPSAVVKPVGGSRGEAVTVGISNKKEFLSAWKKAVRSGKVLVEEYFKGGTEARYLVIGGKCTAVVQRILPHVVGNGVDTLSGLIERKNRERMDNPNLKKGLIELNEHRLSILKKQGIGPSTIPPKGAVVIIDIKSNIATGADSMDLTDEVHYSFKQIAEKAATAVPGLAVAGVDILAHDHAFCNKR